MTACYTWPITLRLPCPEGRRSRSGRPSTRVRPNGMVGLAPTTPERLVRASVRPRRALPQALSPRRQARVGIERDAARLAVFEAAAGRDVGDRIAPRQVFDLGEPRVEDRQKAPELAFGERDECGLCRQPAARLDQPLLTEQAEPGLNVRREKE